MKTALTKDSAVCEMTRIKDPEALEAQGRRSRQIAGQNQLKVLLPLVKKPLTFSELRKKTRFSKPVLAKHLKFWINDEIIYKDTIKSNETAEPKEVGKIVYRIISGELIPDIVKAMETALQLPEPHWNEESKSKLKTHLEAIANIMLDEHSKNTNKTEPS
jgi:DNA-binding HxlR family transcriptional regulator